MMFRICRPASRETLVGEGHRDDDHTLDDLHRLRGHVRVDREPSLRERAEQERREDDTDRASAPEDGDGEAREACLAPSPCSW